MESGNGGASSKGVLVPVSTSSDGFQSSILAPLKSAYLYEDSKQSFEYKSGVLIQNPALEEKYNTFRAKRREAGYSEEDLKESYGFLLFDDVNKANALGETGVLTGNSTCTTLGDPSKGVYISMYSDCLDLNRWYHGKSGYIAIIRLTKGRVKKVVENYIQNFPAPAEGFDCHVSEQLPSVSSKTSSFLAFERTQYYMYELLDDGSNRLAPSPSAACPFAIVSFSYTDTKATLVEQEISEEKKLVCHYFPWRGRLQIGIQFFDVRLMSTAGALIPAELPPVVKVDRAISMVNLRRLLPRAVFETCLSGEVFLDGLYYSLCELVSSEVEGTNSLSLLLWEIKENDIALTILLKDGGFLILLHSSHFLTYDDIASSAAGVLQGMFVFPDSRVMQRDIKFGQRKPAMSSEILPILPVLSYAEGEADKTPIDPSEDLCEVLAQHMQSYAALINPGLASSPSREASIFPDQYDVLDAHKHLYVSPEWSNRAWQSFRSYMRKPVSFQLPVSKASEILAAGQEERMEDLDDDVYICLSSPEEAPANLHSMGSEDELTGQKSPVEVETVDSCIRNAGAQVDLTAVSQNVVPDDLQAGDTTKDLTVLIKADDMGAEKLLTPSTSDDLPAELIVSITSAERSVTESLSVVSTESATKHNDFQLSGFSNAKLQTTGENSLNGETVDTKKVLACPKVTNLTKTKHRKLCRRQSKGQKKVSKACVKTSSLQTIKIPVEDDNLKSQKEDQAKESSGHPQLRNPSNTDCRKVRRRKRKFGKLSPNNRKLRSAIIGLAVAEEKKSDSGQQSLESTILMELEACPLRRKMERWDLKPVISECGRILVPHGSADIADQINSLKDTFQYTKDEHCPEKMLVDAPVNAHDTVEMEQESSTAPETVVDEPEATTSKDGGNHLPNIVVTHINSEHTILKQSDDGNGSLPLNPESREHSSKTDCTDTAPSETVKEKHTENLSPGKCAKKGDFLLSKLKSVLLRGKRKPGLLVTKEMTADTAQDAGLCLKMCKVDSDTEMLKSNNAIASVQDTNGGVEEVSNMLSVDPLFAYALGLTPRETPDKMQKTEGEDTQQRKDSSETQEQTNFDKQPQIIQRTLSIFPRRSRMKTLKKHQDISAEYVKKKWWLHFQTPACFASEKLKYKEYTRDNSVKNAVKEKMTSSCSSTDALNLLADLALSASNLPEQVPPHPDPALEREPQTSLKKGDLTKDVTSAEQSILHALLRQPAASPIQPLESPSPSHHVGGSELVDLVSKEHAYSLPSSSSLLLGLSGTPFQVSPISGSTRLLHHHQTMYGDGIKTLQPFVGQEDRSEHNHWTPEYLNKQMGYRRKFRHSRIFDNKDGSVQVTKQWKENYDFNLDSKFTSDSKDRAVIRALHGPWDFSIQDTSEEVQLIVHMWIGLFYSRTTDRFFHVDSNCTYPYSEESNSLEESSGMVSAPAQSELKANSFAPFLSVSDTSISKPLDLSKKDDSVFDPGTVILDLSLRDSNAESERSDPEVNRKQTSVTGEQKEANETLNTLKSSVELQEASTSQCYRKIIHSTEIINEVNDVRSTYENKRTSQKAGHLEHTDVLSFKGDGTFLLVQEEMESVSVQPENHETASGIGHVLHGCNNDKTDMEDSTENSEASEMSSVQKHGRHSSKCVIDEEVDSNKEAGDVVHTFECGETESNHVKNLEVQKPYQEDNMELSPKNINAGYDSTNKDSRIVCNGNILDNEKQLSREEPKAVKNVNEDVDCCTVHEGKVIQGDHLGKDGLDEKDSCVSPVEADSDLSDQILPMMCDGPDSVKKDCATEYNHKAPLEEQPPQTDNEEDACHDLQLRKLCANGSALTDEQVISESTPHAPPEKEPVYNEPADEEISENDICLSHYHKAASPMSDESTCLLNGYHADGSIPQTNDNIETGSQNKVMANFNLSCNDHQGQDTKSVEGEQKVDDTTQKERFHHRSHSPPCEVIRRCKAEVALTKETHLKIDETNKRLEKIHSGVVIPFIGIDISREDTLQPRGPQSQGKVEEVVQGQIKIPFISDTTYPESIVPTDVCRTSQMYSKKAELSTGKISLLNVTNQTEVSGSESDDRCPTPTMDERPYECLPCAGPSGSNAYKNITQKCRSRSSTSVKDELLAVKSDGNPHHGLHLDLELRTLRVLQSIDKIFSKSSHTDKSSQIETVNMKHSLDQTSKPSIKSIPTCSAPTHASADFKDKKISDRKPAMVSASTSQELHTESSGHFLISPFSKLEEVLGVRLQPNKTDSSVHQHYFERTDTLQEETFVGQDCHPHQAIKPNIDQDRHKTSLKNVSNEPRSYSQRPVMAVKPSKSDEIQADFISKDGEIENILMSFVSKNKHTKTPIVTCITPASMLLKKKTESLKGNSGGINDDKQEANGISSKSSWLSNVSDSKPNPDKAKFLLPDPLYQYEERDITKFKIPTSSLLVQSFESAHTSSKRLDGNQGFLTNSSVKVGQTTEESIEMDQKARSDASTSVADYKEDSKTDGTLGLGPQSSLTCTVYNSSRKRDYNEDSKTDGTLGLGPQSSLTCTVYNSSRKRSYFLEQLSQRCLQDDVTQASMDQECLIFSEQMKQLLKRSKGGPICQPDAHDKLNWSCPSPVTVHFSGLEEESSMDHLDAPSLVGQKIKVDMSDRQDLTDSTEEEKTLHPQNLVQGTGNPMEHAGVCVVTAECARLYEAMMNDVCAVQKVPSRPKYFRMDRGYPKTEPSNHFDFCDQMKREMDESFRSNLNSIVKKSCKTNYRFYILVTSDDAFFEETKAQLEAEGHTAVQPLEFFLDEESSSSLLIILRNEDIAEHICEVPHLLELKKSPDVQFAGIDEPDDVVNLTYQELFTRGGFIMIDRAALEPLSLCNMKKMTEILQELSRTGKWKWMLHYRDSRRLKEDARLSAEAEEKKRFLNWCQEAGILEVLPYHECDLMSRDQPDYLSCLVRLQVQNISARYSVFLTDTTTDSTFGTNGILTMTVNYFLTCSPSETFAI